mmetsp:Transcript_106877/g.340394  ORF Transcript_106877/g.340394 Transcript_106877/m.340394 type:complete len:207 (+) Transcript_106877:92-712(+)
MPVGLGRQGWLRLRDPLPGCALHGGPEPGRDRRSLRGGVGRGAPAGGHPGARRPRAVHARERWSPALPVARPKAGSGAGREPLRAGPLRHPALRQLRGLARPRRAPAEGGRVPAQPAAGEAGARGLRARRVPRPGALHRNAAAPPLPPRAGLRAVAHRSAAALGRAGGRGAPGRRAPRGPEGARLGVGPRRLVCALQRLLPLRRGL